MLFHPAFAGLLGALTLKSEPYQSDRQSGLKCLPVSLDFTQYADVEDIEVGIAWQLSGLWAVELLATFGSSADSGSGLGCLYFCLHDNRGVNRVANVQ
jgi:hypothetical protein